MEGICRPAQRKEGVRVGCGVDPEGGRSEGGVWGGS